MDKYLFEDEQNQPSWEQDLKSWWNSMGEDWQEVLKYSVGLKKAPALEDLKNMSNLETVDARHFDLDNINPCTRLVNLKKLILVNTSVEDLTPLRVCDKLKYLDITFTQVNDISPLYDLDNLEILKCKRVKIPQNDIVEFDKKIPKCKVYWDGEPEQHWVDAQNDVPVSIVKGIGEQKFIKSINTRQSCHKLINKMLK